MVLAYHAVFGTYGFWLPNDPRGSWSDFVGSWELLRHGTATKTNARRSVASAVHDKQLRAAAKESLKYPPVQLSGSQAISAARGFDQARQEGNYAVHACSILRDHVHFVIGPHDRSIGRIVGHFKTRARQRIVADGLWEGDRRPLWAAKAWKVFLNTKDDVRRAITYVEDNPVKEGRPRQRWSFVVPFEY